jgi:alkylhydroperoxidase family enzyme
VTNVQNGHVPDEVYESVRKQFSEKELADLTVAITTINAWNHLIVAARTALANIRPAQKHETGARARKR